MDDNLRRAALDYHRHPQPGKLRIEPTKRMVNQRDLALAYSPGVAAPCEEIAADTDKALDYTARGNLVDEIALAEALSAGVIAGAGLDAFENEAMRPDHPLLKAPNAVLTPHIAGSSEEALRRTATQLVERIVAVLGGTPMDVVNPAVWERRRC